MKVIFDSDSEEDFIEIQLSEHDLNELLGYHPLDEWVDCDERRPINVFIRRGPNATKKGKIEEDD